MKKLSFLLGILVLVSMILPGCQQGKAPSGLDNAGIPSQSSIVLQNASIGDFVWDDMNMNGIQDDGEAGIEGVAVALYNCDEMLIAETTTDADGLYMFDGLDAGNYYLMFTAPDNYMFSPMDEGDDDALDSDANPETGMTECFEIAEDASDMTLDAGMYMVESQGCTRGKGYWKNHCGFGPQDDMVSDLLPLWLGDEDGEYSMNIENAEMAYNILGQMTYGSPSNGITKLYAHLLTAKLNIANGANDDDIADLIVEVDNFLAEHDYEGWSELSRDDKQMVNQWKGMLEGYNEGEIGPGPCDDHMTAYN